MAVQLYGRNVAVNIGGLLIATTSAKTGELKDSLRIKFKVTRTRKKEPNTATIDIYNLRKDNRVAIQEKGLAVSIEAGYTENTSQIFLGDLDHSETVLNGRDWISTVQAADSGQAFKSARINVSIAGPAPIGDVLQTAADALGIDLGNVSEKVSAGAIRGALTEFTNGVVLSGKAEQQLDKIVKSMGYSWSIQDGALQLLGPDETVGDQAFLLQSGTGLVGVPEAGEDGLVKARSLLQPEILPGKKVKIESIGAESISGFYRVEKTVFVGDTWGSDWFVDIEGKPVS